MSESNVPETDIAQLAEALSSGTTVIDVREPEEYARVHVPGACSIPVAELASRLDEVDRAGTVMVVCASGNRSRAGAEVLLEAGYDAVSVAGGTHAWIEAGRPVVTGEQPG